MVLCEGERGMEDNIWPGLRLLPGSFISVCVAFNRDKLRRHLGRSLVMSPVCVL